MSREEPQLPFGTGWLCFGLNQERPCVSTYCHYGYEDLPPLAIPAESLDLAWIPSLSPAVDQRIRPHRADTNWARHRTPGNLSRLVHAAEQADLRLPSSFLQLMASLELQDRIPSCTACYFDLDGRILPCPDRPDLSLVPLLVDQQAVVTWYLLLEGRRHLVVASWINLVLHDDEEPDGDFDEAYADFAESTFICARSFDEFLNRFWFENTLWFALQSRDENPLSDEQEQYLLVYGRRQS